MEHLQGHPQAFLDENNIVINVCVFEQHDESLIDSIKEHFNAVKSIDCCSVGQQGNLNEEFFNNKFYPPKPSPEYIRDEVNGIWILP